MHCGGIRGILLPIVEQTVIDTKTDIQKKKKKRIWELDFLRFVAITLMVVVHYNHAVIIAASALGKQNGNLYTFVDYCYTFIYSSAGKATQMTCGILFCILSGITSSFASKKRSLIKGIKYLAISILLTIATYVASMVINSELTIWFGVLHMLSCSMLLYAGINALVSLFTENRYILAAVTLCIGIIITVLGFTLDLASIPADNNFLAPIGIFSSSFMSSDYYPLLPWSGIFLIGAAIGLVLYKDKVSLLPALADMRWHRPFTLIGRYSIQFYLSHQLVLVGIFLLIFQVWG